MCAQPVLQGRVNTRRPAVARYPLPVARCQEGLHHIGREATASSSPLCGSSTKLRTCQPNCFQRKNAKVVYAVDLKWVFAISQGCPGRNFRPILDCFSCGAQRQDFDIHLADMLGMALLERAAAGVQPDATDAGVGRRQRHAIGCQRQGLLHQLFRNRHD